MREVFWFRFVALAVVLALVGCGGNRASDADHDHDDGGHAHAGHGHDHDHGEEGHHDHGDGHDHDHGPGIVVGPNGGRILADTGDGIELLVTEERKVRLNAIDAQGEAVAMEVAEVRLIAGERSAPTRLSFAASGEYLLSDGVLPEGDRMPVVLQIVSTEGSSPRIEKFNLDLNDCSGCGAKEYVCGCDHSH